MSRAKATIDRGMNRAAFVVCMPVVGLEPLLLPDNCVGICRRCGGRLQYRPTVPAAVPKICMICAPEELAEHEDAQAMVTARQRREIAALIKRGRQ